MDLPNEIWSKIIKDMDYDVLRAFALTNKGARSLVSYEMTQLVKQFEKVFPTVKMEKHELVERIYHLNSYRYNADMITGIVIDHTNKTWKKGTNKIIYHDNEEKWSVEDKFHRIDGPAYKFHDDVVNIEKWYLHGQRHRIDGPAYIEKYTSRSIEKWYYNDKLHRSDSHPAYIYRENNGSKHTKKWYDHGQLQALLEWENNKIVKAEWNTKQYAEEDNDPDFLLKDWLF